jgi:hypothetical protein
VILKRLVIVTIDKFLTFSSLLNGLFLACSNSEFIVSATDILNNWLSALHVESALLEASAVLG